jgi:hypothetical protein
MFGNAVTIEQPEKAREIISELLEELNFHYPNAGPGAIRLSLLLTFKSNCWTWSNSI